MTLSPLFYRSRSTPTISNRTLKTERGCYLYNCLTDPAKLRTDDEHARCRKHARKVRAYLMRKGWAFESENGTLFPR